jgi:hypothetical protein
MPLANVTSLATAIELHASTRRICCMNAGGDYWYVFLATLLFVAVTLGGERESYGLEIDLPR